MSDTELHRLCDAIGLPGVLGPPTDMSFGQEQTCLGGGVAGQQHPYPFYPSLQRHHAHPWPFVRGMLDENATRPTDPEHPIDAEQQLHAQMARFATQQQAALCGLQEQWRSASLGLSRAWLESRMLDVTASRPTTTEPPRPEPKQAVRWWPPVLKVLGGLAWAGACWLFASLV